MKNPFKNLSTDQTRDFYDALVKGENKRGIWGMESRFDPDAVTGKASVHAHFVPVMEKFLSKDDVCLDLGCGPGGFSALMAPLCKDITAADIVPNFVRECAAMLEKRQIKNARAVLLPQGKLPFEDASFDKVIMIDTIHHLEEHDKTLAEVARVLKPGGQFLIFEPNKYNPLLAFLCALDKNEHGLLRLGSFFQYRKLLKNNFVIDDEFYSGLLVGPDGKAALAIADFISKPGRPWANWLSPKLFIAARKAAA